MTKNEIYFQVFVVSLMTGTKFGNYISGANVWFVCFNLILITVNVRISIRFRRLFRLSIECTANSQRRGLVCKCVRGHEQVGNACLTSKKRNDLAS